MALNMSDKEINHQSVEKIASPLLSPHIINLGAQNTSLYQPSPNIPYQDAKKPPHRQPSPNLYTRMKKLPTIIHYLTFYIRVPKKLPTINNHQKLYTRTPKYSLPSNITKHSIPGHPKTPHHQPNILYQDPEITLNHQPSPNILYLGS